MGAVLGSVLEFAIRAGIARHLGVEQFGLFSIGYTAYVVLGVVAVIGTNMSVARNVSTHVSEHAYESAKGVLVSGLVLVVVAGFASATALTVFAPRLAANVWGDSRLQPVLIAFAWAVPLWGLHQFLISGLRGLQAMSRLAITRDVAERGVRALAVLVLAMAGASTLGMVGAYFAGLLGGIVMGAVLLHRSARSWLLTTRAEREFHAVWRLTWPVTLADLLNFARSNGLVLVLGVFVAATGVGLYGAALIVVLLFQLPLLVFAPLFLPLIAPLLARGEAEAAERLYMAESRWFSHYGLIFFALLIVLPANVIAAPFGNGYVAMVPILRILAVGALGNLVTAHCGEFLLAAGKSLTIAWIRVVSFLTAIGLAVALIPRFGAIGAAVAATVSLMLESVMQTIQLYRYWHMQPFSAYHLRYFIGILAIFAGMWSAFQIIDVPWIQLVLALVGVLAALIAVPWIFGMHPDDRVLLVALRKRMRSFVRVSGSGSDEP